MKKIAASIMLISNALFAQEFDITSFIQTNYGQVSDSTICKLALDSLTSELNEELEQGMSWDYGALYKSDDGLIKVYHFSGESCDAYCNPFYQSIFLIGSTENDSNKFIETYELDFDLDSIITLEKGKFYLIFGNHSGRPRGVESVWGQTVVLCSIDDGLEYRWRLESTTSSLVEKDAPLSEISFDSDKMTVSYRYDWYDEMDEFKMYRVSGTWRFNGFSFEEEERKAEYNKD